MKRNKRTFRTFLRALSLNHLPKIVRYPLFIIGGFFIAWSLASWLSWTMTPPREHYSFGTSFSARHSASYGLDWQENYTALLDDMGVRSFRLMSYWDEHEKQPGKYDFSSLDWQMNEAAERGAEVSLSIGLRQPRWPECHEPGWSVDLDKEEWTKALYAYMETVVDRYEYHPALKNFQLENEAFAWWFGDCREQPDRERIQEEYDLVQSWTDKPIWMSLSDQYGLPLHPPIADGLGYSLYTMVYNHGVPGTYIDPSPPLWFHQLRAAVLVGMFDRDMFLHELQLEPWGPKAVQELTVEEQNITMSPARIKYNIELARKIGFKDVYTWGSEWWYWRLKNGDPTIWDAVKAEVLASKPSSR